jgi:hypothetical protein
MADEHEVEVVAPTHPIDSATNLPVTTIHEAELAPGPSCAVEYGNEIDEPAAIARRANGEDIVGRGNDTKTNRSMKFFTPDLLDRFGSEDARIASEAHIDLEERSEAYLRHLRDVEAKLPARLGVLLEQFYLHDSRVISHSHLRAPELGELQCDEQARPADGPNSLNREGRLPTFWIILQLDTSPRDTLILQYQSALVREIHHVKKVGDAEYPYLEWLHDEVDLSPSRRGDEFRHSILFSNGLELDVTFNDFDFATLKPIELVTEVGKR